MEFDTFVEPMGEELVVDLVVYCESETASLDNTQGAW